MHQLLNFETVETEIKEIGLTWSKLEKKAKDGKQRRKKKVKDGEHWKKLEG